MPVEISGETLTIEQVQAVAQRGAVASLAAAARQRVEQSAATLERMIAGGTPIYGVTTGFGALDGRKVAGVDNAQQQRSLLRSHAAGVGPPMSLAATRAMMLIRANVLACGMMGVQPGTLDALLAMLNRQVTPRVPEQGSVGACGDLAPLAHMALPLIGEGQARLGASDTWLPGQEAMAQAGIPLVELRGRDGIALINGTEQTTGIGVLALAAARTLVNAAECAAALSMEALGSLTDSFDERVALAKPHPGQIESSRRLRELATGSAAVLAPRPGRLRDALSLRCVPQVLGAARDALAHCERTLCIEINAANDNPLFGLADGWVTSNSGNFHGQQAGEVLDYLATSMSSVAVMSERRSARLVDPATNGGLPAFLIHPDAPQGVNSGFMIAQYTAASLVAELRMHSVPASIQSIPTCANTEDHVPMAPLAARRAAFAVRTAMQVVAIELLLAAQALDIRRLEPSPALRAAYAAVRARVPVMINDRVVGEDIAAVAALLDAGRFG
ncbi:MAG: histidine ammonia-lyase [Gammaproteobacteria bacterium]|nr:histidine ammonia-lyase [Gammaproteobacteria bacterium]